MKRYLTRLFSVVLLVSLLCVSLYGRPPVAPDADLSVGQPIAQKLSNESVSKSRSLLTLAQPPSTPPYAFQFVSDTGAPGRWDPCTPIAWRLYKTGAPKGALALLKRDFRKLSAVTGLVFDFKGYAPRSAVVVGSRDITIAFMPRSSMLTVEETPDASGAASLAGYRLEGGRVVYTGATVTLLRSRFSPRSNVNVWEPLILHELAHAVGLDHVETDSQVMHPFETEHHSYQPGDIAGLKLLGRQAGCNPIGL